MKVAPTGHILGADRLNGAREEAHAKPPPADDSSSDRITIEGHDVAEQLSIAKLRSSAGRSARLEQLQGAIVSGQYRPDAGQLAERMLSTAEIDAQLMRLLAMMSG